ncbi:MAG TPA: ATP-binding protein [Thermoanaerobaculia bacterium]|nr:ATP-binding protein [Thermoanaerobaculia bacterium]
MFEGRRDGREERVLVLAPTGRDAPLACQVLADAGLACTTCADGEELWRKIKSGAGAAILAEEALSGWMVNGLLALLADQDPWSDLPLIVVADGGDSSAAVFATLAPHANATILERPVRANTLVSAVQASLRARRRQYEVRDLLRGQAETDRRKDEFLAMLGHEIRNPLAAIRNALSILDQLGSQEPGPVRQRQVIERQTLNLVHMVDDLLEVSRVTLGKIRLDLQTVDLREAVQRCLSELGMEALAETQQLALTVDAERVLVEGDPVRIEQVICNLVQNAVKYTPRGGSLSISAKAAAGMGVLRVADSGVGIPHEMLPHIFEPFTQVESSRRRSAGGLGLGLPLVRSLVLLHGGRVEARSGGPGSGSEFVVSLPLKPPVAAAARRSRERRRAGAGGGNGGDGARRPGGGALRVLIVEDNLDGRESLRDLLELKGYQVEVAENGTQGLAQAFAGTPDVALIDIGLPEIDGNEVARRIRATLETDRIALIAMTGYGQPEDRRRALEAGFDTYLVKPVDPADLERLLLEVSRRQALQRAEGE